MGPGDSRIFSDGDWSRGKHAPAAGGGPGSLAQSGFGARKELGGGAAQAGQEEGGARGQSLRAREKFLKKLGTSASAQ